MVGLGGGIKICRGRDKKIEMKRSLLCYLLLRGAIKSSHKASGDFGSKWMCFVAEYESIRGKRKNPPLSRDFAGGGRGESHTTEHHRTHLLDLGHS